MRSPTTTVGQRWSIDSDPASVAVVVPGRPADCDVVSESRRRELEVSRVVDTVADLAAAQRHHLRDSAHAAMGRAFAAGDKPLGEFWLAWRTILEQPDVALLDRLDWPGEDLP